MPGCPPSPGRPISPNTVSGDAADCRAFVFALVGVWSINNDYLRCRGSALGSAPGSGLSHPRAGSGKGNYRRCLWLT